MNGNNLKSLEFLNLLKNKLEKIRGGKSILTKSIGKRMRQSKNSLSPNFLKRRTLFLMRAADSTNLLGVKMTCG